MASTACTTCTYDIPLSAERCPHCALPGLFPNVRAAAEADERGALERRYKKAVQEATSRGCAPVVKDFEAVLAGSQAVIARPLGEVQRLATSDKHGYATYYQLIHAEVRLPDGDEWDSLRRIADEAIFPGYKEHIRFAALSLDGMGLPNYGECSVTLRNRMIEHRATVFEENTAVFMKHHKVRIPDAAERVRGRRATWGDRAKLCVAKLAGEMRPTMTSGDFPGLLLRQGTTSEDDRFVEAHVWGPMTIRTIERVVIAGSKRRISKAILGDLRERLKKVSVRVEVRP